ncbi:sporulation protein [Streptomyces sp. NPDC004286]|uniref:sporulation protein n=1 Tax=Streptomyces sp. NPDC004286 TaxID=3364696 RepID=UPI0036AB381C
MAPTARRAKPANVALEHQISVSGMSHHALSDRVNALARAAGLDVRYTHTSVVNWTRRGMTPKPPVPSLIARALAERLGRPLDVAEIGMSTVRENAEDLGLDFARNTAEAVRHAVTFWSTVEHLDRRRFLNQAFAVGAYGAPVTRWLGVPVDSGAAHHGTQRVGQEDLAELWQAAEEGQRWDSKYGGGNWRSSSVTRCLARRAAPLLHGSYNDEIGRGLFSVTAELARVAGWSAVDTGHYDIAQRHFVPALRMAKAGGAVDIGCHVMANMALQTLLRGYPDEAIDMVQGAYDRSRGRAGHRVLGFAKLIEARAHAKARDARAAAAALAVSERCLEQAEYDADEPAWIRYFTHARLSADAVEVHRDLRNPAAAWRWNTQATAMSPDDFARSVGLRLTVLATTHLQESALDQGLAVGHRAVDILGRVASARARDYVADVTAALAPWNRERPVAEFLHRARTELTLAS